jgi:hypothetical protein
MYMSLSPKTNKIESIGWVVSVRIWSDFTPTCECDGASIHEDNSWVILDQPIWWSLWIWNAYISLKFMKSVFTFLDLFGVLLHNLQ